MLQIGSHVKDFTLLDFEGRKHTLSQHKGKKVVIYFYPKDNTPGCTTQACDFRDNYHIIKNHNVILYGISPDGKSSHEKFSNQYNLPFTLLSDESGSVAQYFGAWGERNVYGKKIQGLIRSTFIVDEEGKIEAIWLPATASKNVQEVIEYLNK